MSSRGTPPEVSTSSPSVSSSSSSACGRGFGGGGGGRRRERWGRARISAPRRSRRAEGDARAGWRFASGAPPEPGPFAPPRHWDRAVRSSRSAPSAATRRAVPSAPSRATNDTSLGRGGSGTASWPSRPDPGRPPWLPQRRCETRSRSNAILARRPRRRRGSRARPECAPGPSREC